MRQARVYIGADLVEGDEIWLDKTRGHYLKNVLRLKPGAAFFLFNARSAEEFAAEFLVDGKRVGARIGPARPCASHSPINRSYSRLLALVPCGPR